MLLIIILYIYNNSKITDWFPQVIPRGPINDFRGARYALLGQKFSDFANPGLPGEVFFAKSPANLPSFPPDALPLRLQKT